MCHFSIHALFLFVVNYLLVLPIVNENVNQCSQSFTKSSQFSGRI